MTDTTHEALNLAEGIGELMEGHEFKAIMLALGNVIAELLTQATDGPEEAADVLLADGVEDAEVGGGRSDEAGADGAVGGGDVVSHDAEVRGGGAGLQFQKRQSHSR